MTGTASIQVNGILGEPCSRRRRKRTGSPSAPRSQPTNWDIYSACTMPIPLGLLGTASSPCPEARNYNPVYTGPYDASETFDHIITSGDSVGADRWNDLRDVFFGEREDVVLAFSFAAPTTPSNPATVTAAQPSLFVAQQQLPTKPTTQAIAQPLYLAPLSVPNTEDYGRDAGKTLEVQAVDVEGSIGLNAGLAEQDYYSFTGNAGDVINVNVMSQGITRYADLGTSGYIDPVVFLYQVNSDGTLTQIAYNDDVFAASADGDASLVDVTLPSSGGFVIKVTSFSYPGEGAAGRRDNADAGTDRCRSRSDHRPHAAGQLPAEHRRRHQRHRYRQLRAIRLSLQGRCDHERQRHDYSRLRTCHHCRRRWQWCKHQQPAGRRVQPSRGRFQRLSGRDVHDCPRA